MRILLKYTFCLLSFSLLSQAEIIEDINGFIQEYTLPSMIKQPPSFAAANAFQASNLFPLENKSINKYYPKGGLAVLDIDTDNELEVLAFNKNIIHAINNDGSMVSNWLIVIPTQDNIEWVPSIGDITGNGEKEIVFSSYNDSGVGKVYAFDIQGNLLPGFPYVTNSRLFIPVLSDVNNNGINDIFLGINDTVSKLVVIDGNGAVKTGFPVNLSGKIAGHVAVGDINSDGWGEIVIETETSLWAFNYSGGLLNGFPYTLSHGINEVFSYSSPLLVDIDNDNFHEILCASHDENKGFIYAFKHDGSLLNGWPNELENWVIAPLQVGNFDSDNDLEIIVGDFNQSSNPKSSISIYKKDGTLLKQSSGFYGITAVNVFDVDLDNQLDIIYNANYQGAIEGMFGAVTNDLQLIDGWPKEVVGNSVFSYPTATDLTGLGELNIISCNNDFVSQQSFIDVWESAIPYNDILTPFFLVNEKHNGYIENQNTTSILKESKDNDLISVFPNPSTGTFLISSEEEIKYVEVFNKEGKVIYSQKLYSKTHYIDLSNYSKGIYFLKVSADRIHFKKLIKT